MSPALILAIIQELPEVFAAVKMLTSLTGNTQARIDTAVAFLVNAIPDSLSPTLVPEIKQVVQMAVGIYDKFAPMFESHAAAVVVAAPVAVVAVAPAAPAVAATGLGQAMPATF